MKKTGSLDGKHIVQIVIKNTSTMDYAAPLLWWLRRHHPGCHLTVLYCVSDKRQILGSSTFFSDFFRQNGIIEKDFSDWLKPSFLPFKFLWKIFFSTRPSDRVSLGEILKSRLPAWKPSVLLKFVSRQLTPVEHRIGNAAVSLDEILPSLQPDILLFDNRTTSDFYGRDQFFQYMYGERKPVVLLPHGPHYVTPTGEFVPFDERGDALPDFCEHWMPFSHGTPWLKAPGQRGQFADIGHPGFDSEWLASCGAGKISRTRGEPIRCLWITRKFLPKGVKKPHGFDPFTLEYQEVMEHTEALARAIAKSDAPVEVIVKPHPSSNFEGTRDLMRKAGLKNFTVSNEPFYGLLRNTDVAASVFSTSLFFPVLYGIPTVVLHTPLQDYLYEKWPILSDLYTRLSYYSADIHAFERNLNHAFQTDSIETIERCGKDRQHIRSFFPDHACGRAAQRLMELSMGQEAFRPKSALL